MNPFSNIYIKFINLLSSKAIYALGALLLSANAYNINAAPAENWQLGFQTPASPIFEGIISFHDDLMVFIVLIICFVSYILAICLYRFGNPEKDTARLVHASVLEIIWTIIPALILVVIAIPSFSLLYSVDEIIEPLFTIKVVGHQWYWSYEFLDPEVVAQLYNDELRNDNLVFESEGSGSFDSYMLSDDELVEKLKGKEKVYRLLTVDNHLFVPTEMNVRTMVTSSDVLHSWAVPSLGVKLDACPGRLNQTSLFIKREGKYYGQCSEICGVNHGFMPIGIVSLELWPSKEYGLDYETLLAALQAKALE